MVGTVRLLAETWDKVWPNLLASLLWVPATFVHITRSNRKTLRVHLGNQPGPDTNAKERDE